jgi:hypothetical protein
VRGWERTTSDQVRSRPFKAVQDASMASHDDYMVVFMHFTNAEGPGREGEATIAM